MIYIYSEALHLRKLLEDEVLLRADIEEEGAFKQPNLMANYCSSPETQTCRDTGFALPMYKHIL